MDPFAPLRSPRLTLRPVSHADVNAICGYRSLPQVSRYQSWETFGPADAAALVEAQAGLRPGMPGTWFQLAIIVTETGTMVGDCGLHTLPVAGQVELGITLSSAHWGYGYATEAVTRLVDFIFGELDAHRVTAVTDAENEPAAKLFGRVGFRREAHFHENLWFKGRWGSEFVFALLRSQWERTP
jgi:RimJ/RimL family protein N-acetyltransferase